MAASNKLAGHLSERRYIYTFPSVGAAQWIVLDINDPTYIDAEGYKRAFREYETNKAWRTVYSSHRGDRAAQAAGDRRMSIADGRSLTPPLSIHAWLRYSTIEALLSRIEPRRVLEIGVGQGSVGVLLARRYGYTGIDLDEKALATARYRFRRYGVDPDALLLGGLEQVKGRQFDLVCAFEVLEHVEDAAAALKEWRSHIEPGGWIALSVPADPRRFDRADEKAGHYRRYTRDSLSAALTAAGFSTIRLLNYGFPIGYLLEAGRNILARRYLRTATSYEERTLASGRWLQPPDNAGRVMALVSRPLCQMQRPFATRELGTGLVAIAERLSSEPPQAQV